MKRPLILIAGGNRSRSRYEKAVAKAGGEYHSFYLPEGATAEYDGLLLCGGGDIQPALFRQEDLGVSGDVDPDRDRSDLELIARFSRERKPVLGICRGMQMINVAFGGTVCQDISPDEKQTHCGRNGQDVFHSTRIMPDSVLFSLYGQELKVNSWHHQCVDVPGKQIRYTQWGADGIPEGLEHKELPVLGVQWHPERTEVGEKLILHFVESCRKRRDEYGRKSERSQP